MTTMRVQDSAGLGDPDSFGPTGVATEADQDGRNSQVETRFRSRPPDEQYEPDIAGHEGPQRLGTGLGGARAKAAGMAPQMLLLPVSQAVEAVATASTPEEFVAHLNQLKQEKNLTYARIGRISTRIQANLSGSSAQVMLTRRQLPEHRRLIAFLTICQVPAHELQLWEQHLARIGAPTEPDTQLMEPAAARRGARPGRHSVAEIVANAPKYGPDGQPVVPSMVEPSDEAASLPPRMSMAPWPALKLPPPRPGPRASWSLVQKLAITAITASAGAIMMTRLKFDPGAIAVLAITGAASIVMWTYATRVSLMASRDSFNPHAYAYDSDFFTANQMVIPSVIGSIRA